MATIDRYSPRDGDAVLPLFSLKGRTAIVSGAGAGIGLAVADALAEAGANLVIWYNSNKNAVERAEAISKKWGVKTAAYQVDVTSQKAVQEAVDMAVSEFNNRLDIFVANAGIPWTKGAILDAGEEGFDHYRKIIATNLDSVYFSAYAAGLHFRRQGTGSFIATASTAGHVTNTPRFLTAYGAAKAAIIHYVKGLAVEWAGFARANSVSPGHIATDISNHVPKETKDVWREKIPLHREGLANELKGAYLYLASDASTYTTGTDIIVDGGYVLP